MKEGLENIVLGAQIAGRNIRFTYDLSNIDGIFLDECKEIIKQMNELSAAPNSLMSDVAFCISRLLMFRAKVGTKQIEGLHI